jgi:hypothetical protein
VTKTIGDKIRHLPKRTAKEVRGVYNLATARDRSLPSFVIIGAQRCGTTSLYHYLAQHPQIIPSRTREVHYFDRHYEKGELWYRSHFPLQSQVRCNVATGESTPYCLCHPHAARRIRETVPDAKLIVLLRDPTDRAISHYFHEVKKGREELPIMQALMAEEARVGGERKRMAEDEHYFSRLHQSFSYKERGIYIEHLCNYSSFKDEGRLLIIKSEKFFEQPREVLQKVFAYLGVDSTFICPDVEPRNIGSNRWRVDDAVRQYLDDHFAPYNERLRQSLDGELTWGARSKKTENIDTFASPTS